MIISHRMPNSTHLLVPLCTISARPPRAGDGKYEGFSIPDQQILEMLKKTKTESQASQMVK